MSCLRMAGLPGPTARMPRGFSYSGRLSSVVGWLGYGGNLSWSKQRYVVESIFGVPMSQGSLAKVHQWFCAALQPAYEQWWSWIQQPGVRCVDETSLSLKRGESLDLDCHCTGMLCPVLCPHPQFSRGQDTLGRGLWQASSAAIAGRPMARNRRARSRSVGHTWSGN